jgi:hypothetical protein
MQFTRNSRYCSVVVAVGMLLTADASAATQDEEALAKAQSPHQRYGSGGTPVKVHRVRLDGYLNPDGGNDAVIARLKKEVAHCLANNGPKSSLKQITDWPTYFMSGRIDEYTAANRRIRYQSGVAYSIHPANCGLIGELSSTATLKSAKGICQIDLVKKIAVGDCDRNGHADAPVPKLASASRDDVMKRMAANPAMAASLAQMKAMQQYQPVRTGEQHVVLGARCDVWRQKMRDSSDSALYCYASGGSFVPAGAPEAGGPGGLALESDTPKSFRYKAVEVQMDTKVNSAVFTPYIVDGYTIDKEAQP